MTRFRYCRDPLFVIGCIAYAVNRWLIRPHVPNAFLHGYFDDLWLIPCALPPVLWLNRRFGLRTHDGAPTRFEIALHLTVWSVLCEWIGPALLAGKTADPLDVVAYAAGAVVAAAWWRLEVAQPA